jgi:hypothetical protein
VYNSVIEKKLDYFDYFIILDDDSGLPLKFFIEVERVLTMSRPPKVALPKIYFNKKLISPGKINYIKGKAIESIDSGVHSSKNLTGIMSGTVISTNYLRFSKENYGFYFNEKLDFYSIDTCFFKMYRKEFTTIFVLDVELEHSSALRSDLTLDERVSRYMNLYNSWKIVYSESLFEKLAIRMFVFYSVIKSSFIYRTTKFFRCL